MFRPWIRRPYFGKVQRMTASDSTPGQRLQKLAAAELAEIGRELARAREGKDTGVHRARKAMQRLRSILRLARKAHPDWVARTDLQLQRMRRRLGRLRDSAVRVELVEGLLKREPASAASDPLQRSLLLLRQKREAAWQQVDDRLWERLEADWLRQARRFEDWPLLDVSAEQIERALQRARRRVRDELRAALGTVQRNRRHDLRRHLRRYAAMRSAAAKLLRRRDAHAVRLVDAARALGEEGDLWLTCMALRVGGSDPQMRELRAGLERQRKQLCQRHDGELVALRRSALGKTAAAKRRGSTRARGAPAAPSDQGSAA